MFVWDEGPQQRCKGRGELFFGDEMDGREEEDRAEREAQAIALCVGCPLLWPCLEYAMVRRERFGVWGGMGETERKNFRAHLRAEGYTDRDMPTGLELYAAARAFHGEPRLLKSA